jgi:hypothetical protein
MVPDRSLLASFGAERPAERSVLLFGILTGSLGLVLAVTQFQESPQLDYHAYYFTGRAVLDGEPFVGTAIHEGTLAGSFLTEKEFVYTPVTAPLFAPYGLFPNWQYGYVINVGVLAATFYAIGRITIRYIERHGRRLARLDRWLILGFTLLSGHTVLGLYRGNVDPIMLLLITLGFLAIERDAELKGGALWAFAALFKLFPAFLGVWLLYRRATRAIAAAVVTGVGSILLGVLLFGVDAHRDFVDFVLNERSRKGAFEGGLDPEFLTITLRRPLSQVLALSGNQLILVSTALVAPFVAYIYYEAESDLDRTAAFFATVLALLVTIVPVTLNYVVYLFFPAIALLYLVDDPRVKQLFVVGLVLVNLPIFPEQVELIVGGLPLPAVVGDAITGGARTVMTYASVPLWGFTALFAGCLRQVRLPANG